MVEPPAANSANGIRDGGVDAEPGASELLPGGDGNADLVQQVQAHYRTLLLGNSMGASGELEAGYQAATELLRSSPESLDLAASPLARSRRAAPSLHGTAAQKIGTLLLVGAILHGSEQEGDYGALPLILIDDPEAHLHPITLASIWAILDRVSGQKMIGTHSGILLSAAPVHSLRRLTRSGGVVTEWRVPETAITTDESGDSPTIGAAAAVLRCSRAAGCWWRGRLSSGY